MTEQQYFDNLADKINVDGKGSLDAMQYARLLLAYNRRILDTDSRLEFDMKVEEIYPDLICKAYEAKSINDDKSLTALSNELVALCEPEIQNSYNASKSREKGIYEVHNFVQDLEFQKAENTSDKSDLMKMGMFSKKTSDIFAKNELRRNKYKNKLETFSYIYSGNLSDEELLQKSEELKEQVNEFVKSEGVYFAGIAAEFINQGICEKYGNRYYERSIS